VKRKAKSSTGCFFPIIIILLSFLLIIRIIIYIPVSVNYCSDKIVYVKGSCLFQEIDERYIVLRKQYLGDLGFFNFLGVDSKPIYLYDKMEKQVIKEGEIIFGISPSDIQIEETNDFIEIYYKVNYGNSIFSIDHAPSLRKPWRIKKG